MKKILSCLFILIFIPLFLSISSKSFALWVTESNKVITIVGDPTGNISIPPPPPPDQIKQALMDVFGIEVSGTYNYQGLKQIYDTMSLLARSSTYMSYLNSRIKHVRVVLGLAGGTCGGRAPAGQDSEIHLYNPLGSGGCRPITMSYTLTHELGHLIDRRTNLIVGFRTDVFEKDGLLKTYPFPSLNSINESFAEMMADYVVYKTYAFPYFPTTYPNYYRFARDIIFGGVEY